MCQVSVLLSVWNGMPFLPTTVESVLGQRFGDFQFVINDNGSTDGSLEYLQRVSAEDARVIVISDGANHGHSGGLNRALAECSGRWTARIDADDVCLPERLGSQLAFFKKNPKLKAAGTLAYYINEHGARVAQTFSDLKTEADFRRYWETNEMIGLMHPSVMYETAAVRELGGYRQQCGAANDIDLWCRLAEAGGMILVQQEYLIEYRVHAGQISAGKFREVRDQYEWVRAMALARRKGLPEPGWDEFLQSLRNRSLMQRVNRSRKVSAKYYYRQAGLDWICAHKIKAIAKMSAAVALQPGYAMRRFLGQRYR